MPHYFFHIRDDGTRQEDREGLELPDAQAARKEAVKRACAIWSKHPPEPGRNRQVFEIADETGVTVLQVPFSEAFAERAVT